jgi:CubicO group peptidase (beta-lactamase class C family)
MIRKSVTLLVMGFSLCLFACTGDDTLSDTDTDTDTDTDSDTDSEPYWPDLEEWETISPEEAGARVEKLDEAIELAASSNSGGLIILYNGRILTERYWQGWDQDTTMAINSATKSMTSIMVGMGLDDGSFDSLDQHITDFAPQWTDTPKDAISLEHFLTMTTGLHSTPPSLDEETTDQFEALADTLTLDHTPGTVWEYNTPAYYMMFTMIEKATGESLEEYSRQKLFSPLGMNSVEWVKTVVSDEVTNYRRIESNTRDMARFGLFTQHRGVWNDERLVSEDYFDKATTPFLASQPNYGYLYWLHEFEGSGETGAIKAYSAMGKGQKIIMVIPSMNLVITRHGDSTDTDFTGRLLTLIVQAFAG